MRSRTAQLVLPVLFFVQAPAFDADRYLSHIKFLSSPELAGRATGSIGLEKAAEYIERQFRADGLKPAPRSSGFLQRFEVTTGARLGKTNRFEFTIAGELTTLAVSKEFIPFSFSASGKTSGGVVFAGYGITAPEYRYDDYSGIDVKGRFVVVLAHEPQEYDPASVFEGRVYTEHAQYYSKALNARRHGARGVILVSDRRNHRPDEDGLEPFLTASGPPDAGIPFVQVKNEVVEPWFRAAGKDLGALETEMDGDLKPRSCALPGVEIRESVVIQRTTKFVGNVVAWLPGLTDEYVIMGAHYDHLGLGGPSSMAPSLVGTVHPGADDNASGTAGVIEMARWFSLQPAKRRGMLFVTFAGEELGLLGSEFYADHPELPLGKAVAMINLDMIGRVRDEKLYVGGAANGSALRADVDAAASHSKLRIDYSAGDYGSSDHTSFVAKRVPVLFFFSGLHGDYHRPGDTWEKIETTGALEVMELVADVAARLAEDQGGPFSVPPRPKSK